MQPHHRALEFCDRFGLRLPILQAPIAGSSPPELAIAVAQAGGMGASGALQDSPERIAQWTRRFRASSDGAFQINIWIPEDSELDPRERQQALAGRDDVRRP